MADRAVSRAQILDDGPCVCGCAADRYDGHACDEWVSGQIIAAARHAALRELGDPPPSGEQNRDAVTRGADAAVRRALQGLITSDVMIDAMFWPLGPSAARTPELRDIARQNLRSAWSSFLESDS